MRILLAHDLSEASELAASLILHAAWPASTVVRVISTAAGIGSGLSSFANLSEVRAHTRQVRHRIALTHQRVAADLREAGVTVETRIVAGKPAHAILAEAERFGADLIAVGARRQGSIAAMLLGSVSRAVVEGAACSVLVAQRTAARHVLLATDGSAAARFATTIVGSWPLFKDSGVLLVGVGDEPPRDPSVVLTEAMGELAVQGRRVRTESRTGEVATQIVAAARDWPADIVVLGANSRPLLQRLFLGTVARRVLDGVTCSVLIARQPPTSGGEPADEPTP